MATLLSLAAALLFYAGAVHTRAFFEYFHIDHHMTGPPVPSVAVDADLAE
ncbi:hypothetical protein [Streptomyces agglomeratus]|nr:hypothetical protein [Streptomyces agglomeratus]